MLKDPHFGPRKMGNFGQVSHCYKEVEQVNPHTLQVDYSYQRESEINKSMVKKIVSEFDPILFLVLVIARRPNGDLFILDGLHRWLAAIELGLPTIPCSIHDFASIADEAYYFKRLNKDRTQITPYREYKASIISGDKEMISMGNYLKSIGMPITPRKYPIKTFTELWKRNSYIAKGIFKQGHSCFPNSNSPPTKVLKTLFCLAENTRSLEKIWSDRLTKMGDKRILNFIGPLSGNSPYPAKAVDIGHELNKGLAAKNMLDLALLYKKKR